MAGIDNQPTGKRETAAGRRLQAFEMRKRGASYRQIGAELGVSGKTAWQDVQEVLKELAELGQASAAEYVAMEEARLDLALVALAPKLRLGDPQVVNAWVKVSESRRKLRGLDAPTKVAPTNADGTPYRAYTELRTLVLAVLPMEERLRLADALDKMIDVAADSRPDDRA